MPHQPIFRSVFHFKNLAWTMVTLALVLVQLKAHADPKNESSIKVDGVTKLPYNKVPELDSDGKEIPSTSVVKWCHGSIPTSFAKDLQSAGISFKELKEGVSCIPGDFDDNGYMDFILYSNPEFVTGVDRWHSAQSYLVVFFKGSTVDRVQVLGKEYRIPFQQFSPRRQLYPEYKNLFGFSADTLNNGSNDILFYDQKTRNFKVVSSVPLTKEELKIIEKFSEEAE